MKNTKKPTKIQENTQIKRVRVQTLLTSEEALAFKMRCLFEGTTIMERIRGLIATHMKDYKAPKE